MDAPQLEIWSTDVGWSWKVVGDTGVIGVLAGSCVSRTQAEEQGDLALAEAKKAYVPSAETVAAAKAAADTAALSESERAELEDLRAEIARIRSDSAPAAPVTSGTTPPSEADPLGGGGV